MQRPSSARRGLAIALGIAALLVAAIAVSRTPPHAPALHGRPAPPSAARRGPALLIASSVSDAADAGQIARIERLALGDGDAEPHVEVIEDPRSSVDHIALCDPEVPGAILAATGGEAALVRWRRSATGAWRSEDLWRTTFGPVSSRMRDVALVDGAALGRPPGWLLVVGTHDQGVVALATLETPSTITELDRRPATLVHEIEIGDLDGDGRDEIYATISPPNTLLPTAHQPGAIVRYDPAHDLAPELWVDLAPRHAKEILVTDLDGDGRDELYAAVEGLVQRDDTGAPVLEEPVAIRRVGSGGTAVTITTLPDRQTRFLVAGDLEGTGRRELVAATFSAGLFRIATSESGAWTRTALEAGSGGYEHAITLADLDHDGRDEIYEADDPAGELRRVVVRDGSLERTVLLRYAPGSRITWNLTVCDE